MMHSRDFPPTLWDEVVNCLNYIHNHTPLWVLDHMNPEQAWSGTKPDVSCFRVFSSHAWAFILKTKHKDLDKKSKPLIFVSYCEDMKAYRLIDLDTHDLLFHTHVQFDECHPDPTSSSPSSILLKFYDTSYEVFHGGIFVRLLLQLQILILFYHHHLQLFLFLLLMLHIIPLIEVICQNGLALHLRIKHHSFRILPSHHNSISSNLVGQVNLGDPQISIEAHGIPKWDDAMMIDYSSLLKNNTWELVPLPHGRNLV